MERKYSVGWGLTNICNMNCKFCYSKETRISSSNTKLSDWIRFIDDNAEYIEAINYGTGENSLCDDFFYFVDYVRRNYPNIKQSLTTNGYIYERVKNNPEFKRIYQESIDEVDVSLDFHLKEKHVHFRGQEKAFDWAINTLQMLKDDKKKASIVFVGFEDTMTIDNLEGLFEIAKRYNAILRLNIYRPVSESEEINQKFILSYSTLIKALQYIAQNHKIVGLSDVLFGNVYSNQEGLVENTGVDSIRILPDGNICPSTYLISDQYKNKYNIKQGIKLKDIRFEEFEKTPIPKECSFCSLKDKCRGGVYDRRILWYGSLEERDPYCPKRNNEDLPTEKYKVIKKGRISVHDGYLPTMFFEN